MLAVTISVSWYAGPTSASMAAPVSAAETQGSNIRGEKVCEPQDHQETTSRTTTAQQVRDEAQETTPEGEEEVSQVSGVTWDDSQPARLAGLAYIIGDFTDILSSIFLCHVGEGEHLHI